MTALRTVSSYKRMSPGYSAEARRIQMQVREELALDRMVRELNRLVERELAADASTLNDATLGMAI